MKFTDGYWLMRPGVHPTYPVEVLDVTTGPGRLRAYAPGRHIHDRGDLLKGPMVTVELAAPMPDVIKVVITHFAGGAHREPHFELAAAEDGAEDAAEVRCDETAAALTSGALTARIDRRPEGWRLDFAAGGRTLTGSGFKAMAVIDTDDGRHYVREQLDLGVDHFVYGLGERFGPLVKNGQVVDIWNADGGTASEQAYKNVPFFLTNAGYGVFVNHPGLVSFEVGSEAVSRVQFSVEGQSMEYHLIYGPTPKEILRKYTALTGRPPLVPAWSYGLWLSTSFTTSYDEDTVTGFIEGMAERDLPLSVFHFDTFWMREFHWCDFEWDPRTFPDPRAMLERLKARGLRICVWINPYIAQRSALFEEGKAKGYLLRRPNGDVWQWDHWQPGLAIVDFTNPEARQWWAAKLDALLEMGVDCFKSDFGERIPTDVVWHDGSDPERMHNYYTHLFNETVFELLRKRRGEGEAIVFARSATVGGQRFPVHWSGDSESTFEAMAESLRGGLSLGMSGFGYWSHDIGGFEGTPDAGMFKRWIAFGLLSSHSRLHGSGSYRVPWLFDEEAVDVLRVFTRLKMRLMPYLLRAAGQVRDEGLPVLRAMVVEFPDDPACTHLERQYMFGDDLLVAPVFSSDGEVSYYVPEGTWTHLLTGARVHGPRWVRERHGYDSLPLLVRPGAVVPMGAVEDRPEYDYADGVTLRLYELPDGADVVTEIPGADGSVARTFRTRRRADTVRVETSPGVSWQVLLVGVRDAVSVEGGAARPDEQGLLVEAREATLVIELGERT
ncbi:alpha-D-xyloside xylohydrolase [Thermomonospora echinospora]|uniref:alpha-D-xyloside xylohydrolase n=1 Tax=Thermomonospora echinospora TaxID=1992 RepID=A0A1H6BUY4_9ACTN|nr:alpha-xylosidase [Thermomonospora echinospora]SEG64518.1 alpha-D-xyloside xylohydrolase [Thermomonospora echinospora]